MSNTDLSGLARDSIEAYNRSDWPAVRAVLGEPYAYEEAGTNRRFDSADAAIAALQDWKRAAPDVTGEVVNVVASGDTAVLEITWRGTQTGPLATAAGELPASGRPFEIWGCMWQHWRDGKIVEERHHLDVLTLLGQLGALPAPHPA